MAAHVARIPVVARRGDSQRHQFGQHGGPHTRLEIGGRIRSTGAFPFAVPDAIGESRWPC